MRTTMAMRAAVGLATLVLAGCITVRPPAAPAPSADPVAAWARVLERHVTDDGRIDFAALRHDRGDLETYVAWAATHGPRSTPEQFPSRESRLAYYINTYNAVAMYHVVANGALPENKVRFFFLTRLSIDGEPTTLYAFENRVIRPLGDPRVHFALNCMVRGCPRLPRVPFTPAGLDRELDVEARRFLSEPRNVKVDAAGGTVRLSSILKFYTEDFLAQAPSLIAYTNRYRAEAIPEGYAVRFIPYDWTLNQT